MSNYNFKHYNIELIDKIKPRIRKILTWLGEELYKEIEDLTQNWPCNNYKDDMIENSVFNVWIYYLRKSIESDKERGINITKDYIHYLENLIPQEN